MLFDISPMGMTVVVANDRSAPRDVAHPAMLAPIDAKSGADDEAPRLAEGQMERWEPEKSPDGPVSVVISAADRRAIVLRNGIEIGRARIALRDPEKPVGTHAFVVIEGGAAAAPGSGDLPPPKWVAIGVPGHESEDKRPARSGGREPGVASRRLPQRGAPAPDARYVDDRDRRGDPSPHDRPPARGGERGPAPGRVSAPRAAAVDTTAPPEQPRPRIV